MSDFPAITDLASSIPWHATFTFLIPLIALVVQMHYPNSSPLDGHPTNMWIFILCLFIYTFAFGGYIKFQISTPVNITYQKLCDQAALFSGSLACVALISLLVPHSLESGVFIIYFMLLVIYVARNLIIQTCKNIVLYVTNKGEGTESDNDPATTP